MVTPARTDKPVFPYLPEGREILFVPLENKWMKEAKAVTDKLSGCSWWPTGAVVVKHKKIIGAGANQGAWQPLCPRVENNCPTGEGYHYCKDICQQEGHGEVSTINNVLKNNKDPQGADLYLYGHWWCCEPCWNYMIKHGIKNVYLLEDSHLIFTREKRLKLMKDVTEKLKVGGQVIREDTIWEI